MSDFLHASREVSGGTLFDQWEDLEYLPLPSAVQAKKTFLAARCIEDALSAFTDYLPPIAVWTQLFRVQLIALRDSCQSACKEYFARYYAQGSPKELDKLAYAFGDSVRLLIRWRSTPKTFAEMIREIEESARVCSESASRVLQSARIMDEVTVRVDAWRSELSDRRALEWLVGRWSELSYCR
jgi:hypothetical protein